MTLAVAEVLSPNNQTQPNTTKHKPNTHTGSGQFVAYSMQLCMFHVVLSDFAQSLLWVTLQIV